MGFTVLTLLKRGRAVDSEPDFLMSTSDKMSFSKKSRIDCCASTLIPQNRSAIRYHCLSRLLIGFAMAFPVSLPAAAPGPPIRTGLWVTQRLPDNPDELHELESQLRANHNLSGVCLHVPWREIVKPNGQPDFALLEKTIVFFRDSATKYQICLHPGAYTPDFVYKAGAQPFEAQVKNPHRADFGKSVKIPVPWDPVYQRYFSQIIRQLGDQYGKDPLCVSVVLTCANFMSAEMHLP